MSNLSRESSDADSLHSAVQQGEYSAVEALLNHGSDVNACILNGVTPLMEAATRGHLDIVKLLLARGAILEARTTASKLFGEIDPHCDGGYTALHCAAFKGYKEIVAILLQHGAMVDLTDDLGTTALQSAACGGDVETVRLLLRHRANPHVTDTLGNTALTLAEGNGHKEVAAVLRMAGGNATG